MNIENIINSFFVSSDNTIALFDLMVGLILPAVLALPAAIVYKKTQSSHTYSAAFLQSLFLFATLSSVMTMIIGNNVARAFGLIGALSLVRFRNALKSPIDAVYIFWALGIGLSCGTGFYLAGFMLTATLSVLAMSLSKFKFGEVSYSEAIIRIQIDTAHEEQSVNQLESILKLKTVRYSRINIIFDSTKQSKTYVYQVAAKNNAEFNSIQTEVGQCQGVVKLNTINSTPSLFAA